MLASHIKIGNLYRLPARWSFFEHKLPEGDLVLFLGSDKSKDNCYKISVLHDGKICWWELEDLAHVNQLQTVDINND